MLGYLRENSGSIVVYVFVAMIVVVFALQFGPGSKGFGDIGQGEVTAAEVRGRIISWSEFSTAYNNRAARYNTYYGPEGMKVLKIDDVRIRTEALDELINRELWAAEAERLGLTVGDDEIDLTILRDPSHYDTKTGKFDEQHFKDFVNHALHTSVKAYRVRLRSELLAARLRDVVAATVKASDEEAYFDWKVKGTTANLEFVKLSEAAYQGAVPLTGADVDTMLATREADVKARYDRDAPLMYSEPKKVRARHILKKVDPTAPEDVKASRKAEIEALLARVKAGEDFATLATAESDDVGTKVKGGDLDFFDYKTMVPEFATAAFALKPGEVSAVVETKFGYHIIKVEEVREAKTTPFDTVKRDIAEKMLREERGNADAKAKSEELYGALKLGATDLAGLLPPPESAPAPPATLPAGEPRPPVPVKLTAEETGAFSPTSTYIKKIGESKELLAEAFKLTKAAPLASKVYYLDGAYFVVRLKERTDPAGATWATDRLKIVAAYAEERTRTTLEAASDKLRAEAEKDDAISINPSALVPPPVEGESPTGPVTAVPPKPSAPSSPF
jgi:peptidyl-prolyl cis-trans isomerase D